MALLNMPHFTARCIGVLLVSISMTGFDVFASNVTTSTDPTELRDPENPETTTGGLNYDYYEGTWEALPDFTGLAARKLGTVVNIDLGPRNKENDFAFRFTGFIEVPTDGVYTFYSTSDDGSHWTALYRGENHELLALGCLGNEVFVGGRGLFLHSLDEGATWYDEELDSLYTSEMVGMYQTIGFGSKGEVYVGGEGGYNPATVGSLFRRAAEGP